MDSKKNIQDLSDRIDTVAKNGEIILKYTSIFLIAVLTFYTRLYPVWYLGRSYGDVSDLLNLKLTSETIQDGFFNSTHPTSLFILRRDAPFPGTAAITSFVYWLLSIVGQTIPIDKFIYHVAPVSAACTVVVVFLIGCKVKDGLTGVFAAGLFAAVPAYSLLTMAGKFDNSVVGLFFAMLTLYFFLSSCQNGSFLLAGLSAVAYTLLACTWEGFIVIDNVFAAYIFFVLALNKSNWNIYWAYTLFYALGSILSSQLPSIGYSFLLSKESFFPLVAFVAIQVETFLRQRISKYLIGGSIAVFVVLSWLGILQGATVAATSDFYHTLRESGVTTWILFFKEIHVITFLFPAGLVLCLQRPSEENLLLLVYGAITLALSSFFRKALIFFAPVACLLAAFGLSTVAKLHLKHQESLKTRRRQVSRELSVAVMAGSVILVSFYVIYAITSTLHPSAFTPSTMLLAVSESNSRFFLADDYRESSAWLNHNLNASSKILTWPGHATNMVLAPTKLTQASTNAKELARFFLSNEKEAHKLALNMNADYVLISFGGHSAFPQDTLASKDEMIEEVDGSLQLTLESALYKMSYKRFQNADTMQYRPRGYDLARDKEISKAAPIVLKHFQEIFTSSHWVIRVFKVMPKGEELDEVEEVLPSKTPKERRAIKV